MWRLKKAIFWYSCSPNLTYLNTFLSQNFLFTNECLSNCLKSNIKIYIKIAILAIAKLVFYSPTNAQVIVLKTILKFTLK